MQKDLIVLYGSTTLTFTVINAGWIMTKAHDSVDIVTRERSDPNDMMSVRRTLPAKFLSLLKWLSGQSV